MYTKTKLVIIVFFSIFLLQPTSSFAQTPNVLDCLENSENCEEQSEPDESGEVISESNDNEDSFLTDETANSTSLFFSIVKTVIALFFVLALIYIITMILRKRNSGMLHNQLIESLGGISLGQNKSVQIIRIGSNVYALGVGEQVELLFEIDDPEVKEILLEEKEANQQAPALYSLLTKYNKKNKANSDEKVEETKFTSQLENELSKLLKTRKKMIHTIKKDDEHV